MGSSLVQSVPTDPEDYKRWLEAISELFAKWDDLLSTALSITTDHLRNLESDKSLVGFLAEAFDARLEWFPIRAPGGLGLWTEYTYTLDLDLEVFTIDSSAHFHLQRIPTDWISTLGQDEQRRRFVHPRLAPEESIASLAIANHTLPSANMEYWNGLTKREVTARADCVDPYTHLQLKLFDLFENSQIPSLRVTLNTWTADDLLFRELAYFILSLAAGDEYLTLEDERRILSPIWMPEETGALYGAVVQGDVPEGEREFIGSVGAGFHLENEPIGTAPAASKYWFKGVLVCLVPRLNEIDIMEKAVADAVRHGREGCGRTSFNAVLISIAHLVLLRSFPDGSIEHTGVMKLLSTSGSLGMDAQHRYDSEWLDDDYERQKAAANKPEETTEDQAKAEDAQELTSNDDDVTRQDQERSKQHEDTTNAEEDNQMDGVSGGTPTSATTQIAGAGTSILAVRSTKAGGVGDSGSTDLASNTSDEEHVEQAGCGNEDEKSRLVDEGNEGNKADERDEEKAGKEEIGGDEEDEEQTPCTDCIGLERWDTGDTFLSLTIFLNSSSLETLKPTTHGRHDLPIEITDMILGHVWDLKTFNNCAKVSRAFRSCCLRRPLLTTGLRLLKTLPAISKGNGNLESNDRLRFFAEQYNGNQLNIEVRKAGRRSGVAQCFRVLAGAEYNRKSFSPITGIDIENLELPDPFQSDIRKPYDDMDRPSWHTHSDAENAWDLALHRVDIINDGGIRELARYWERATGLLHPEFASKFPSYSVIEEPHDKDWLMPANTKQYCIQSDGYRHKKYERFLLLRIKRASRYWGTFLWDQLITEIKEYAAVVDEHFYLSRNHLVQSVGAANPQVILVVGLQVRLFEWKAEGTLIEKEPGHLYSVMNDEDRKTIETVLASAVDRLQSAKKKEKKGFHVEQDDE
ncbi:MAG: hypothetical protein Q9169_007735 [Polycauliona sp. 2 TL-2023]